MTFAHPWMLVLLLPIAAALGLLFRERMSRRQRSALLGESRLLARLLPRDMRPWPFVAGALGLLAATVAAAGPSWGAPQAMPIRRDRDVMIVLDVSRSMNAEQPSRLEQAKRALHLLVERWREAGKHRVGMVVVAGRAKLAFPLTADLDHLRFMLDRIEPDALPWSMGAEADDPASSGTRMGAGIRLAVESLDGTRLPRQDLVLLSDGDDPAGDDEWMQGVKAATDAGVPIHVVSLGDSAEGHPIPHKGKLLTWRGDVVRTRRNDAVLGDIARLTGGVLFPGTIGGVPLGRLLEDVWAGLPPAPEETSGHAYMPNRAAWLLIPAIALLAGWARWRRSAIDRTFAFRIRPVAAGFLLFGGAAAWDDPAVSSMRLAHGLFQIGDYAAALALYEQAEAASLDPGNAAYHQAACAYELGRFADAAERCLRVLDDADAPKERLARAWFLRGNALVASPAKRATLEEAMEAYRRCIAIAADADLQRDARQNLDLAAAMWTQAVPEPMAEPMQPNASDPQSKKKIEGMDTTETKVDAKANASQGVKAEGKEDGADDSSKKRVPGSLRVLPEQDQLVPLSVEETEGYLDQLLDRIANESRKHRMASDRVDPNRKDW
ncbi:MAG: VWA domain-containing protein [Gemmataceae bacterium]|nr:VWA domain-containing protein [Gemmataceae bacterium]